jgi:DNA repair photolyase
MPEPDRIWNPPNPYVTEHRELLGEAPPAPLEIYEDESQSILSENDSPDIGFRWSVNPYRGCFHACAYCYARPTHEYFGFGAGTDFERRIFVKRNAPELLERAFRRRSWTGEFIMFSGVTDCYQPIEAAWKLTQGCLKICLAFRNPAGIVTKSLLVRRDAGLLAELARTASARVSLSIPFLNEEVVRRIEPGAPTVRRRFETMELLAKAGVPVGIGVAPIIPGLNDADIPGLLKEAKRRGASFAFHTLLRLPGSVKAVFFHRLREQMPLRASKIEHRIRDSRGGKLYDSRFGHRHEGQGNYWEAVERVWALWIRRLGFARDEDTAPEATQTSTFRRPVDSTGQLTFPFA